VSTTSPWKNRWIVFAAGGVAGAALGAFWTARFTAWSEPDIARYREVRDYARSAFVHEVTDEDLVEHALHGLADGLDDYSEYYDPTEAERLERETAGRYDGLGVVLKPPFREGRILFPLDGSPAMAAGVRVGDRFVRVGGQAFEKLDEAAFHAQVSGPEPRDVDLVLVGLDGVQRSVRVRTGSVVEPTVRHERILDESRGIGYLAITSFSHETAGEFDAAFERLRGDGMRALVLDLRGNPGGVLVAAVEIAQRFVHQGLIVTTEGREQSIEYAARAELARNVGFPLVLLVDEGSASASEVLASALQEHRDAVIVGSPTYGKGMVQTIHRFAEDGSVLKVTTSYYYTPTHRNLEHSVDPDAERGLQPDLRVALGGKLEDLHARLTRPSPPRECVAALKAWEESSGEKLIPSIDTDPQLAAALDLFAGERPGPHASGGPH
jgi:carboxyl-terminal processing protease